MLNGTRSREGGRREERTVDGTQERTLGLANLSTKRQRIAELARRSLLDQRVTDGVIRRMIVIIHRYTAVSEPRS
jgi:hypothetical protein